MTLDIDIESNKEQAKAAKEAKLAKEALISKSDVKITTEPIPEVKPHSADSITKENTP